MPSSGSPVNGPSDIHKPLFSIVYFMSISAILGALKQFMYLHTCSY